MIKMSTLFKKDHNDLGLVIDGEYNDENRWVFDAGVRSIQKFNGTACAMINGLFYKRFDAKKGREIPSSAIPCGEADPVTGHHPHWVLCDRRNSCDKWHWEAFNNSPNIPDGTYELCGVKINGNHERIHATHKLIPHANLTCLFSTEEVLVNPKEFMRELDIEGIVFHHPDGRMCKIRKSDFGLKR